MLAVDVDVKPLVERARAGEPEAWSQLFQRYQLPLYAYVQELVRQEQTSLDIVQETFIQAIRHAASLRDDEKFGSWLFGIAHQKCLQHWRKQSRERRVLDLDQEPPGDWPTSENDPSEWLIRHEREEEFMAALNQLPPPHRAVVLLHFMEDFPLEEIAVITGAPLGTVKSRLHYAKQMLRRTLEETT
jgi:RNA polymerase sigma-70 factor, ECF subfamily